MKSTVVDGAIPETSDGHFVALLDFERVTSATSVQDARPNDTTGPHHANFGLKEMHAPSTPRRTTVRSPVQLCNQLTRVHPLGQRVTVATMRAEDDVGDIEMSKHAARDGLLANVSMARTMHEPSLVGLGQLLFALPNNLHGAVQTEHGLSHVLIRCRRTHESRLVVVVLVALALPALPVYESSVRIQCKNVVNKVAFDHRTMDARACWWTKSKLKSKRINVEWIPGTLPSLTLRVRTEPEASARENYFKVQSLLEDLRSDRTVRVHREVATVHWQECAGDERRRVRGQEYGQALNVIGVAESTDSEATHVPVL